jgi:hypothetical protein
MGLEEIIVSLNTLGIGYAVLESGADGGVLVLPEYGRVLGLWPHWRGENSLWVNPTFLQQLRIGAKDDGWMNPGGDRMWLAPEEEFFAEGQGIPPALDPGQFARVAEKPDFCMENRGEALAWKSGARVRFKLTRRLRPMGEAELAEAWGTTWLRPAGYEEVVTLELQGDRATPVWLWNVTQVPAGAQARIPLRKYWGDTGLADLPAGTVGLQDNCAIVGFQGTRPLRVGVGAAEIGSRILCLQDHEQGRSQLLVKDFARDAADGRRGPLVECRWTSERAHGEFSCMSPPVGPRGRRRLRWRTTLCAFSGRSEAVRAFAARISG